MSVSPRKRLRDLLLQKQARNNASSATANNAPITTATTANNTPSTTAVIFSANDLGADGLPVRSVLAEPPRLNVMEDTYINLRNILPPGFSYLLYYHKETKTDEFLGAPGQSFMACIRVNVMTEEAAKEFIVKFNATSLSTFRVSRGAGESKGQKVIFQQDRHCQHSLEVKKKQGYAAVEKENNRPLLDDSKRARCTKCPARFHILVENPLIRTSFYNICSDSSPKRTHPCILKLWVRKILIYQPDMPVLITTILRDLVHT